MVDHFRNLPELEDALNKLGIKADSLEEELDDDIRVEERFWVGGKPKRVRHFKGDEKAPILEKEWYKNGQLKELSYSYDVENKLKDSELSYESKNYYENGQIKRENIYFKNNRFKDEIKRWWSNGQLSCFATHKKEIYYDKDGNEINNEEWRKIGRKLTNPL